MMVKGMQEMQEMQGEHKSVVIVAPNLMLRQGRGSDLSASRGMHSPPHLTSLNISLKASKPQLKADLTHSLSSDHWNEELTYYLYENLAYIKSKSLSLSNPSDEYEIVVCTAINLSKLSAQSPRSISQSCRTLSYRKRAGKHPPNQKMCARKAKGIDN
jgi:hypothetical protein